MSRARQARRKERQKEHDLAEEAAERVRASRRKSVVRLSRGALVAVAVAVVGALVTTGISDVAGSSGQPLSVRVDKEVSALLSGIPQSGGTLGQTSGANYAAGLWRFGECRCPHVCAVATTGHYPRMGTHKYCQDSVSPVYDCLGTLPECICEPADRSAGCRRAEQVVELHRDVLPRAGSRTHTLRNRSVPRRYCETGSWPQHLRMGERS
jgi:hypothetical protein